MPTTTLAALHLYPVKSLSGVAREKATMEPWGLAADRRWMLNEPDGSVVTQREHPRLALATALPLAGGGLTLSAPGMEPMEAAVPSPSTGTTTVRVFRTKVEAAPAAPEAHAWFSAYLGVPVQLMYLDQPEVRRAVRPDFALPGETVSFADEFPLLLTTTSSLDALNSLIAQGDHADEGPLPMNRFRPSVVIDGTAPWAEDGWGRVRIGEVTCRVAKGCGRCVITTTDQTTAERGKEPLRTLAHHRRVGDQLLFGVHMVPENTGTLRLGDTFEVLEQR